MLVDTLILQKRVDVPFAINLDAISTKQVMEIFSKIGRIFYGSAIAATGIQQFFFREFFQILFPPLPYQIPGLLFVAYLLAFLLFWGNVIALKCKTEFFAYTLESFSCLVFVLLCSL
jgi:hypothetical protein